MSNKIQTGSHNILTQRIYNTMAKIHSSIFGSISGKHGSAVAVTRRDGISYIRMHVIPHNPRTDKQQAHRSKIGLVSKSLAPFNPIFKHTMGATNGISIARSHAFKNAIMDEYPNFSIDYKKLMFSFGTLQKLQNATTSFHNGIVSINWDFKKKHNSHGNDSVSIIVFNKDANKVLHIEDIALRKKKQAKIDIHESWADSELYFWAYVRRGDKVSDSVFVGECCGKMPISLNTEIAYTNDNQTCAEATNSLCSGTLLNEDVTPSQTYTRQARNDGAKIKSAKQRLNSSNSRRELE